MAQRSAAQLEHSGLGGLPDLRELASPSAYMARHSRSFRFAASLLRGRERERIIRVYAWCRFTDDIVDRSTDCTGAELHLGEWLDRSRAAYDGSGSGIPLVDQVMKEMADRNIPFAYAAELVDGVRSDLHFAPFPDYGALRVYTHSVAGVVGRWLTELHGVNDSWMLERAAALGHAMQLTNILRDVGEDWCRSRIYIPLSALAAHGISQQDIGSMRCGERAVDVAYRDLMEELMAVAAHDYAAARAAIPHLPGGFRRSVAVAAAVYEGIHDAIRRNGYDNLRLRAVTSSSRKLALAMDALLSPSLFLPDGLERVTAGSPGAAGVMTD